MSVADTSRARAGATPLPFTAMPTALTPHSHTSISAPVRPHRSGALAAGWAATAGGVAWLAKIGVIVATDGRVMTTGAAAWLMRAGLLAWVLAAGATALWLTRRRGTATRVAAVLGSPVAAAAVLFVVGTLATAAIGRRGPAYLHEEFGILVIGALGLALGAATLRRAAPDSLTGASAPGAAQHFVP